MTIGDRVTWKRQVRAATINGKRYRITTGVIIEEKLSSSGRAQCRVQILFYSGTMPQKIEDSIWVSAQELLVYRCKEMGHLKKTTPFQLLKRRQNQSLREARQDEQLKSSREQKKLLREIQNLKKAA